MRTVWTKKRWQVENNITEISVGTENEESVQENGTDEIPTGIENAESVQEDIEEEPVGTITRTGRSIRKPEKLVEQYAVSIEDIGYETLLGLLLGHEYASREICAVGDVMLGGFENTKELKVLKFEEAMNRKDRNKWLKAVEEEYDRFKKNGCFKPVERKYIDPTCTVMTSTWVMKKKASGKYRARLNSRDFEQIEGKHYNPDHVYSPVTNEATIRIVLVLMIMAGWSSYLADVNEAFLMGEFENEEALFLKIPKGFESKYSKTKVLRLRRTIYGLKQADRIFWILLLIAMRSMKCEKSKADLSLYFKMMDNGLLLWLSWIDECLCVGNPVEVAKTREEILSKFEREDVREVKEYLGCKIDRNWEDRQVRLTHPVLLQSYKDEFDLPPTGRSTNTPALAESAISPDVQDEDVVEKEIHSS